MCSCVCTRIFIYSCTFIHVYTSSELRILSSAVYPMFAHTCTHLPPCLHPLVPVYRSRSRERGNSHLRATIKTIDDWRGHLDLKIYLRGSASHTHTHTLVCSYIHTGPHFKTGLNYWSALPITRVSYRPFPALCRCLASTVYVCMYIYARFYRRGF